ncbi:GSCOCG00004183001-RA-CDS [Cotesia congregata]|nr:GSCOCG00004183001-RA-CDS [Cotesia congregata]
MFSVKINTTILRIFTRFRGQNFFRKKRTLGSQYNFMSMNFNIFPYQITEQRILIRYTWLSGAVKLHTFQLFFWQSSVAKGIWILSNSTISFHSATSLIIGGKSATFSSIVAIANFV